LAQKILRNTAALKTLIFSQSMGQVHPTKLAKNKNSTLHSGTLLAKYWAPHGPAGHPNPINVVHLVNHERERDFT
jgi:hypothetical protein